MSSKTLTPETSVTLSVFGLDQHPDPKSVTTSLEQLRGVRTAKLDLKKKIVKIVWNRSANLTKEELILAVFRCGVAAEELA
ncbi:MAG: hypothetical protein HKM05_05990 [Spirochaetales bacterium]|nr:hypothetical protein [Spirochaetales bacterium]